MNKVRMKKYLKNIPSKLINDHIASSYKLRLKENFLKCSES